MRAYDTLGDLLLDLDAALCKRLLHEVLPGLSLLDPACGCGAFLVAAMKTLINVYAAVIGKIKFLGRPQPDRLARRTSRRATPASATSSRSGSSPTTSSAWTSWRRPRKSPGCGCSWRWSPRPSRSIDLEPLPNIDFNILAGNSLIGLMRVDDDRLRDVESSRGTCSARPTEQVLEEKNRLIDDFPPRNGIRRRPDGICDDASTRRSTRPTRRSTTSCSTSSRRLGIKYEQATWDEKKNDVGKPKKRPLKPADIEALHPFHWGFEFDEILNKRGGFDAIITNPPWEIFKPNGKEFFEEHSDLVSKKNMTIHEFEKEQAEAAEGPRHSAAWLEYLSQFPHQSAYFRSAPQYRNQISIVNGKKAGTDINLYKLFVEQCYNLLKQDGRCGMITPGSIYNDLGAKQLRRFSSLSCQLNPLFGLSNERYIFEGVEHRQSICIFAFRKGNQTDTFFAAFRINPREAVEPEQLDHFFHSPSDHLTYSVSMIRRLSPGSLSVMEFKSELDVSIADKIMKHPLLGDRLEGTWNIQSHREFHMTNDSYLFVRLKRRAVSLCTKAK